MNKLFSNVFYPAFSGPISTTDKLTFVSSNATITPAITLSSDGPCQWEVTESDGTKYYYSVNSFSHTKTAGGNIAVRLLNTMQVAPFVTALSFVLDGIISSIDQLLLSRFASIVTILLNGDPQDLTGGSYLTLPQSVVTFQAPGNMLNTFPMLTFPSPLATYLIGSNGFSQHIVDSFIYYIFSNRFNLTAATPTFAIGGTNSTPSGIYQFENPPGPGKPMIYWLVNDPLNEGFNKEIWTYTA